MKTARTAFLVVVMVAIPPVISQVLAFLPHILSTMLHLSAFVPRRIVITVAEVLAQLFLIVVQGIPILVDRIPVGSHILQRLCLRARYQQIATQYHCC